MPTIYHWLQAISVDQKRYNQLIQRLGYYATPTRQPSNPSKPDDATDGILNLLEFKNVDATGEKDSTAGIQAAIDAASSTGQMLYCPPGLYNVKTLEAKTGLVMVGQNPSGSGIDTGKQTRFGLIAGTNAHFIHGATGVAHVRISGIHFDGNKNNNTSGDIVHLDDAGLAEEGQWHIRDCFLDAAAGYGIYVGSGRRAVQISDCTVNYSKLSGIRMNGSDGHIDRCIIGTNMEHGIGVGGTVCNINDCDIYGNGTTGDNNTGDGITIFSTITQVGIHGNRIDQNKRHGILVSGSCEAITISGNILHGNSQHANGSHHGISVLSTTGTITLTGNTSGVDGNVSNKPGYFINLPAGGSVQGNGNVMQSGSTVNGFVNLPKQFAQTQRVGSFWVPSAAKFANMDRANALLGNVAGLLVSGRLTLAGGLVIPAGCSVSNIAFLQGNTAVGTPLNQWFCLVDQSGNVLAKTVDDTTTPWSPNAIKTLALSATYTPVVDTAAYIGLCVVATTMPDLRAANASTPPYGLAPVLTGSANTGLTNPASLGATIGAITAQTANPYGYVS